MNTTILPPKTLTKVGQLSLGDRFYFISDKQKNVHTVTQKTGSQYRGTTWATKDGQTLEVKMKYDDVVIYLRNINQPQTP